MLTQLIFNSLVSGLVLALIAVGFNLVFHTTRVFHIAHGAIYICGAYALIHLMSIFDVINLPYILFIAILVALIIVSLLAWLIETLVYRPLSNRNSGQAITLISSMGVYLFLINLVAMLYGNETKFVNPELGSSFSYLNIIIVPIQAIQLTVSFVLLSIILLLTKSKWYLQVKALISDETVATVMGVNTKKIRYIAIIIGSILASVAAMLRLFDTGIDPQAGMTITLSAAVAVIIGGSASITGTIVAALLIAALQTTTEWFLSAQWKEGMTFLLLIIVILWRTEGIVSFKMRVEEK